MNAHVLATVLVMHLLRAQNKDSTLSSLFARAVEEQDLDTPICFHLTFNVLMRRFRPVQAFAYEEWNVRHQIVVPYCYRKLVLSLAHDCMGGHLGIRKTYHKIMHFFWPGLRKDVSEYCRTCHICQMPGKPNQVIKPH